MKCRTLSTIIRRIEAEVCNCTKRQQLRGCRQEYTNPQARGHPCANLGLRPSPRSGGRIRHNKTLILIIRPHSAAASGRIRDTVKLTHSTETIEHPCGGPTGRPAGVFQCHLIPNSGTFRNAPNRLTNAHNSPNNQEHAHALNRSLTRSESL